MRQVRLSRDELSAHYTIGTLSGFGRTLHTIENPWLNNFPFLSCVPAGEYDIVPVNSPRWGKTIALSNPDLGVFVTAADAVEAGFPIMPDKATAGEEYQRSLLRCVAEEKVWARYACYFHAANWARNVDGCIGPGMERSGTMHTPDRMVSRSNDAMAIIIPEFFRDPFKLLIEQA